jgi:hypothetical protein
MKNSQKGFIVPVLLVIIALLVVGGGVYIYENKKVEIPAVVDTGTQPTNQNQQQTNTQTPPVTTGLKTYSNSGIEFKYPATWAVTKKDNEITLTSPNNAANDITLLVFSTPTGKTFNINCQPSGGEDVNSIVDGFHSEECKTLKNTNGVQYTRVINAGMSTEQTYKERFLKAYLLSSQNSLTLQTILTDSTGKTFSSTVFDSVLQSLKFNNTTNSTAPTTGNEQKVLATAREVIGALAARDYQKLEGLVSSDGLSLNFYPQLDLVKNLITKSEVSLIPKDTKVYLWGYTDGKGDPINLTRAQFLTTYIYSNSVDYLKAPDVAVNKTLGSGNSLNTISKDVNGRTYVAFHFSGFDPKYGGMDWTTLYLVFDSVNGEYKLRAITKDNWTI